MNKSFIAYFDILGYKDAILNTSADEFQHRVDHILRDIELSLSLGQTEIDHRGYYIGDQSSFRTNVHYISDTILFWPKTNSVRDIENWLRVSSEFNRNMNLRTMPIRGCLYYGEFQTINWHEQTLNESIYSVASMFGKALVNAHLKAENQSWASSVIDVSVLNHLPAELLQVLTGLTTKEQVPYKSIVNNQQKEHVLRLHPKSAVQGDFSFYEDSLKRTFQSDSREFSSERILRIYNNTISLLARQLSV